MKRERKYSEYAIELFESGRGEEHLKRLWFRIMLMKQGKPIPKGLPFSIKRWEEWREEEDETSDTWNSTKPKRNDKHIKAE